MIRDDWPAGLGPCHHHRTSRPRLSYSTVSSAPPVVVLLRMTRQAFPFGPPSLVRDSVTVVCVPSGRVSWPNLPKPSYTRRVTSWLGSVSLVTVPNRASTSTSVGCIAALTSLVGKMPSASYVVLDTR